MSPDMLDEMLEVAERIDVDLEDLLEAADELAIIIAHATKKTEPYATRTIEAFEQVSGSFIDYRDGYPTE